MIIKTDPDVIQSYLEDESGLLGGRAEEASVPENAGEIPGYLLSRAQKKIPVTVSGAGTGVTGGRVPMGGALLSTEKLNRILSLKKISPAEARMTLEPAVTVKDLKAAALAEGWMYAPDPTEQSSWIGGNVSTNASGSRGLKYGSTRNYIKRLKAAFTNGETLDIPRGKYKADSTGRLAVPFKKQLNIKLPEYKLPAIKNAAGYFNYPGADLLDVLIGSEGTLCAVTEVEVALLPAVRKTIGGIAFFTKRETSWEFVNSSLAAGSGLAPLSLEYLDKNALELLRPDFPHIPAAADSAIFFEQETTEEGEEAAIAGWGKLLESYGAQVENVWFSATQKDQESFREFRHRLPEKVNEIVKTNKLPKVGTDIAVPRRNFPEMMRVFNDTLANSGMRHLIFGHIGESHMHANILPASEEEYRKSRELYIGFVDKAVALGGTASAEHGIGKLKHVFLEKMVGKNGILEMVELKKAFDPAAILGRGNIFPKELL
jgi:D-lactate dehydrogenase (cytochrome)